VTKAASDKTAARIRGQLNLALSSTLAKAWILERLDNEAKEA
jgi:hypothetical protein